MDLEADRIEAYSNPEAGSYRTMRRHVPGETAAPSALPDLELAVAALIPAPPCGRRALNEPGSLSDYGRFPEAAGWAGSAAGGGGSSGAI